MEIFTGNYQSCKRGNLISISADRGKSADFNGKVMLELAPERVFWKIWRENIGKIPEEENTRYYIQEYYKQVLSKVDVMQLLENERAPILLCYEPFSQFCHRHVLAEYLSIKYGIKVHEIEIGEDFRVIHRARPQNIRTILLDVMNANS